MGTETELGQLTSAFELEAFSTPEILKYVDDNTNCIQGPESIECNEDECVILTRVRNGITYIDEFIDHYRNKLNAKHIFILDNNSHDGTVEKLQQYKDISIFQTRLPFKVFHHSFTQYMVHKFGWGKWSLVADIDEFFDYPFSGIVFFNDFIRYLSENDYTLAITQMLDVFSQKDLIGKNIEETNFRKDHVYYDISNIVKWPFYPRYQSVIMHNENSNNDIKFHIGGIRKQVFGLADVWLTKHSLMRFNDPMTFPHPHLVTHGKVADVSGLFYHYKFLSNFKEYVDDAVKKEYHENFSMEYKEYLKKMEYSNKLILIQPTSRKLNGTSDLLKSRFIIASDQYLNWIMNNVFSQEKKDRKNDGSVLNSITEYIKELTRSFNKVNEKEEGIPDEYHKESDRLKKEIKNLEKQVENIKASYSWRIGHNIVKLWDSTIGRLSKKK